VVAEEGEGRRGLHGTTDCLCGLCVPAIVVSNGCRSDRQQR
jgi:hypothetical protein